MLSDYQHHVDVVKWQHCYHGNGDQVISYIIVNKIKYMCYFKNLKEQLGSCSFLYMIGKYVVRSRPFINKMKLHHIVHIISFIDDQTLSKNTCLCSKLSQILILCILSNMLTSYSYLKFSSNISSHL